MPIVSVESKQLSERPVSLKDVNTALRNNYAILESLDEDDPKRGEIEVENEKLFSLGFEILTMQV